MTTVMYIKRPRMTLKNLFSLFWLRKIINTEIHVKTSCTFWRSAWLRSCTKITLYCRLEFYKIISLPSVNLLSLIMLFCFGPRDPLRVRLVNGLLLAKWICFTCWVPCFQPYQLCSTYFLEQNCNRSSSFFGLFESYLSIWVNKSKNMFWKRCQQYQNFSKVWLYNAFSSNLVLNLAVKAALWGDLEAALLTLEFSHKLN